MDATVAVVRVAKRFTCPCSPSSTSSHARGSHSGKGVRRVDSHQLASCPHDLCLPFGLRLPHPRDLRQTPPQNIRCLYSPLVESFEASRISPLTSKRNFNDEQSSFASSGFSFVDSSSDTAGSEDTYRVSGSESYERMNTPRDADNCKYSGPRDPVATSHGDQTILATSLDDLEARKTARRRPAAMSLSQGLTSAVSSAVGVPGRPIATANKLRGPAGVVMAIAVAALGLVTAVQQKGLFAGTPKKICSRCDGYGVECCDVCEGHGQVTWEGKMSRVGSCPRCFGSCLKKCPRCDGNRVRKGNPPILQQLQ